MPRKFGFRKQHTLLKGIGGRRVKGKRFIKRRKLGKYSKRKRFMARKPSSNSKLAFALNYARTVPDQVYLSNYTDAVQAIGTTNAKAVQAMWAIQSSSSGVTNSVQVSPVNLMPHDLGIVQQILFQQFSGASTIVGAVPTTQVLIKSWTVEAVIRNIETGPIELYHYRCIARRDMTGGTSSPAAINNILANGFADAYTPAGTPTGVTNPVTATTFGATPFMNPRFVANVKVIKSKKYVLNPGAKVMLRYKVSKPRLWKNEDFNFGVAPDGDGSTGPGRGILRGQHFSVFRINGTFASSAASDAGYDIGIGNAAVGIVYQHKIHYAVTPPAVMQTAAMNAVAGYSNGVAGYALPIVATQPYSTINETTGARVLGTTFPAAISDVTQLQ